MKFFLRLARCISVKEGTMMLQPLKSMPLYGTFWREFTDRPTVIYIRADPRGEAYFRDVVSLLEISRVFPHGLTQVRFCPVIPGVTPPESPAPGEGIIILGRPEHYQSDFINERIVENLFPPLRMAFDSNDLSDKSYRTVTCALTEKHYNVPRERDTPAHLQLEDFAMIYYGQARAYESEETSPCLILSGTSTLGTWGASVFATSPYLLQRHVGYSPWYQGILGVAVRLPAPGAPFLRHNLALHVTESFFRACWVNVIYQDRAPGPQWRDNVDFEIFINDRLVTTAYDTWRCFIALALEQQEHPDEPIQLKEVEKRLRQIFDFPALHSPEPYPLASRLSKVCAQVLQYGVYMEPTSPGYRLLLGGFEETVARMSSDKRKEKRAP
jgi:hypothetical protein